MSVNMTAQVVAVGDNWTKVGNDYVGDNPSGIASFGTAALGGTLASDDLTITTDGTYSFGTKANAKPMYFWDANDQSLNSSSLSRRAFTLTEGVIDTSGANTGSSARLRIDIPQHPTSSQVTMAGPFVTDLDGAGDHICIFSKRNQSFTGLDAYSEQQRLSGTAWNVKLYRYRYTGGSQDLLMGCGIVNTTSGNPFMTTELTPTAIQYAGSRDSFGVGAGWKTEFLRIKQGTQDTTDSLLQWHVNGNTLDYPFINKTAANPNALRELFWPQTQQLPNELDFDFSFDCFYLDDTPQMVLISDSATWQDSTSGTEALELAIPITWTDTAITATVRKGEFSDSSGKYVYVLNGSGEPVTTTGVQLP